MMATKERIRKHTQFNSAVTSYNHSYNLTKIKRKIEINKRNVFEETENHSVLIVILTFFVWTNVTIPSPRQETSTVHFIF